MLRHSQTPSSQGHKDADASIRLTDSDAAVARLSAVQKQYLHDPFVQHLVPRAHLQPPRPPLINIGTYVRSEGIDELVNQWLVLSKAEGTCCQIVSLGAGSDSRYWRIATGPHKDLLGRYIEVDFPEVTSKKAMTIRKNKHLSSVLGDPEDVKIAGGGTTLHARNYHLLPADLRLPPSDALSSLLSPTPSSEPALASSSPILSKKLPTLLLFECVLVYMAPSESSAVLQWFVDYFSRNDDDQDSCASAGILGGVVYEMFGLNDSFGRVMVNNLKSRNVSLPGAEPYPTPESLPTRFLNVGFNTAHALTLRDIRRFCIDPGQLERISTLEMLDEIEELELVLQHYAITWGVKLPAENNSRIKADWKEWGLRLRSREILGR